MNNVYNDQPVFSNLECRILRPLDSIALNNFFIDIIKDGDDKFFHPHEFNEGVANYICNYIGRDAYYAIFSGGNILGYGILRGWDDGYEVPSLGIVISSRARGLGLGKMFMLFLHSAVKNRGAKNVRLTVLKDNIIAQHLYESLGYKFEECSQDRYLGSCILQ